jgi:hypothetical protein
MLYRTVLTTAHARARFCATSSSALEQGRLNMFKFGVAVVRGPLEVMPMTRLLVEEGSTLLHVAADVLNCTATEAEEEVTRLEVFTSYGGDGKTHLGLADLTETMGSLKADGFRAIKFCLHASSQPAGIPIVWRPQRCAELCLCRDDRNGHRHNPANVCRFQSAPLSRAIQSGVTKLARSPHHSQQHHLCYERAAWCPWWV